MHHNTELGRVDERLLHPYKTSGTGSCKCPSACIRILSWELWVSRYQGRMSQLLQCMQRNVELGGPGKRLLQPFKMSGMGAGMHV
eukprot:1143089-Pelagomonas_calceolata.AAC.8